MKKIEIPTNCPVCNSILVRINDQLFCKNKKCSAQIDKKIQHFAKTLGIKGLGEKTVEKLNLSSIIELFYLSKKDLEQAIGETLALKLFNEIEKSKASSFAVVLSALSIPLIGETAAKKLANLINKFDEITQDVCTKAGLGEKATQNLLEWLQEEKEIINNLPFTFEKVNSKAITPIIGVICITGKLHSFKNKAEATKKLEELGYKVTDSLTKDVSILIDEENKGSSKRKTAEERGLKIVTNINQLLESN